MAKEQKAKEDFKGAATKRAVGHVQFTPLTADRERECFYRELQQREEFCREHGMRCHGDGGLGL